VTLSANGYDLIAGELDPASFRWSEGGQLISTGPTVPVTLPGGDHLIVLEVQGPAGGTATSTVAFTLTTQPVTGDVSLSGQVRTTAGTPLDGATVEIHEVGSGRTQTSSTPSDLGAGTYAIDFVSALKTTGPADATTYEMRVFSEGALRQSTPASIVVTSGRASQGLVMQDILVP
ncbi:MAG: hypothetical protein HY814_03545, partial [Candidatus Riflebacteria bacterium]|nr:hypothetical protein [Candidatus Riflebacteria bacterium]